MIPYKQLSLADIYSDCQDKLENDKPAFLSLLENHIDLDEIIPISFRNHFLEMLHLTQHFCIVSYLLVIHLVITSISPELIYRLIPDPASNILIAKLTQMAFHAVLTMTHLL